MVRVHLVQTVSMLPHQSMKVAVWVDESCHGKEMLLVEPSTELRETTGLQLTEALVNASSDGLVCIVLSNPTGVPCQLDMNACVGVVHGVVLVETGTMDPLSETDGSTVR